MSVLITEELRVRSSKGRELVECEEDVQLVEDFKNEEAANAELCAHLAHEITENAFREATAAAKKPSYVSITALSQCLADVSVSPGPEISELINKEGERILKRPLQKKRVGKQPDPIEFLGRPYHDFNRNRFLFSCADEPDGYAQNRDAGWNYKI